MTPNGAKFQAAIAAVKLRRARPRKEDRRTIEAIIWRLDNSAKWRPIPTELGDRYHAYLCYHRWAVSGVWDKIRGYVVAELRAYSWRSPASTVLWARAHQQAAGGRRANRHADLAI